MTNSRPYKFQISAQESADGKESLRYSFYIDPLPIHSIVFKGGGMRVFLYQKFLEIIEENGILAKAPEVGASSSGAIAAFFAAIPFEDGKRTQALDLFNETTKGTDILGTSLPWRAYRLAAMPLALPLAFFSKAMSWSANTTASIANQFNKIPLGNVVAAPLNLLSSVLQLGTYISTETPAALFNTFVMGGLFIGDELQTSIRNTIQIHTKNALQSILENFEEQEAKENIAGLISIGLLEEGSSLENLRVTADLTFRHFHHLANLRGSQFKEIFMTAARKKDFVLKIFNYANTPDLTIHRATRIAMSIPYLYQDLEHEDEAHIDGGCVNNYPMRYANPPAVTDPLLQYFGINNKQARLGVRVERQYEFNDLWKKPDRSYMESLKLEITRFTFKRITTIDSFASDAVITKEMLADYPQRSIQIDDQGVSLTEFGLDQKKDEERWLFRKTLSGNSLKTTRVKKLI